MKIIIYIEKTDFDAFFIWVNRLNQGILSSTAVEYALSAEGLKEPLEIQLEPDAYSLIQDAETDLKTLSKDYGDMDISFEPQSLSWELKVIRDVLRNSKRRDLDINVVYTALYTMTQVPGLLPGEAMIISEREWITAQREQQAGDI